ncbi:MAG: hypothetical protein NZ771_00370, partial [Candidatus Marinimicrobia bacterium]|nr:hypothetical protein [Candidatus Neomarinimicrobiota bacterium]
MNFKQQDMMAMKNTLKEMVKAGQIKQVKGKRYALSHQSNTFVGVLTVTQKGFGFVITENDSEDIFIGRRSMADAIHGDKVQVSLKGRQGPQGPRGRVDQVIERGSENFIGVTYRHAGKMFMAISPVNPSRGIRLIKYKKGLGEGQIVKARVKDWGRAFDSIIAELESVVGRADDPANDVKMIMHKFDYHQEFSKKVMNEVAGFNQ